MVDASVLFIHSGQHPFYAGLDGCLSILAEPIHPNALRDMDERRFVTNTSHSAWDGRLTFDDSRH